MTAELISNALGGRRVGRGWIARCPGHDDRSPSLSILETAVGRVLVRCHAGCDQQSVIDALRTRGLWANRATRRPNAVQPIEARRRSDHTDGRTKDALRIWEKAAPVPHQVGCIYLRARGITVSIPPTVRLHHGLKHPSGEVWPALVAMVTDVEDTPVAIHRTFLSSDGSRKASVEPQKMMLGPCRGGAVRLANADSALMVGEGIETCLAAIQATGRPAWAALSTSGLRALVLPPRIRDVVILADGDDAGEAAAIDAAQRWCREGRLVQIARPPRDMDFNDLLMAGNVREESQQ
jgi:putative DNA primase/helicase